jgi:predicted XRE-type DNA-binding protein
MLTISQRASIKKKLFVDKKTITQLAEELGFSRPYVSGVVNGSINNEEIDKALLKWKKGE